MTNRFSICAPAELDPKWPGACSSMPLPGKSSNASATLQPEKNWIKQYGNAWKQVRCRNENPRMKIPNSKSQIPKKSQIPSSNDRGARSGSSLGFGVWDLFGLWALGFGI